MASGKGCRVIVSPSSLKNLFTEIEKATGWHIEQHAVFLVAIITALWSDGIFEVSCIFCLHLKEHVCSPVLCGSDVVSSLAYGVEMPANSVSPSPSVAVGTTPSSISSSLSSLAGNSGKTQAV